MTNIKVLRIACAHNRSHILRSEPHMEAAPRSSLKATDGAALPLRAEPVSGNVCELRPHCPSCSVRGLCLPFGLDERAVHRLDEMIHVRTRVRRKEALYRPGDRFTAVYAIQLGTFKTTVLAEDGREQVVGYHMAGEVIGLDGIGDDRMTCEAVALEDSEVCLLPWSALDRMCAEVPGMRNNVMRAVSRGAARASTMMLMLGSRTAGERLSLFLLDVAERYQQRGYSSREFVLRVTREEIASYLGLKLETVSRVFSSLQERGFIQVQGRAVKLLDAEGLRRAMAERE
jgi:CRP/FNR family transcriptional regulator